MHIRLLAVGDRQPPWVSDAFSKYAERFPRTWKFSLDTIATARRNKQNKSQRAVAEETQQILTRIRPTERVILLDEQGKALSSAALASNLSDWQNDGRDLCFVIGGPDGVADAGRQRADFIWSLSSLTLPHGLARVLLAEQLYRAWSLNAGHPYHRA